MMDSSNNLVNISNSQEDQFLSAPPSSINPKGTIISGQEYNNGKIIAQNNSLVCKLLSGTDNNALIEKLRVHIKSMYAQNGYNGFSDEYDQQFDPNSAYFYVTNGSDKICAIQRVIHKIPGNLLPMERAIISNEPNNKRYLVEEQDVAEITSFVFNGSHAVNLIAASIAHYGKSRNIKKAFALLDVDANEFKDLYFKIGWRESQKYTSPIFFPDYGKIINGKFTPTLWRVLELSAERIAGIAEKINKYEIIG